MILVDVIVPAVDKKYDFKLEEHLPIGEVTLELVRMIGQKEQSTIVGDMGDLRLCNKNRELILNPEITLSQAGIGPGDTLILV